LAVERIRGGEKPVADRGLPRRGILEEEGCGAKFLPPLGREEIVFWPY